MGCRPRVLVRYRQTPVYTHRQTAHEYGRLLCLVYTFGEIGDFNEYKALSLVIKKLCLERQDKDIKNIDMYLYNFLIFFQPMQQQ